MPRRIQHTPTLADPTTSANGYTLLYQRQTPPANNNLYYQDDEGTLLGVVIMGPGVPRWMSSSYSDALEAHNSGQHGADFSLYSHDWFEKIVYVPVTDQNDLEAAIDNRTYDPFIVSGSLVDHALSTGCQQTTARTILQSVTLEQLTERKALSSSALISGDTPPDRYYAIVSKHVGEGTDNELMGTMKEVSVAKIDTDTDLEALASSKLHLLRLQQSYGLRHQAVSHTNISTLRRQAFDSVKASAHTP